MKLLSKTNHELMVIFNKRIINKEKNPAKSDWILFFLSFINELKLIVVLHVKEEELAMLFLC